MGATMRLSVPASPAVPFSLVTVPSQVIDLSQKPKPNKVGELRGMAGLPATPLVVNGGICSGAAPVPTCTRTRPGPK